MEIQGGKLLTFLLDEEIYGISLVKVREIIQMMEITLIPKTKKYTKGVINLRGKIIPIIDLRLKFGMEEKACNDHSSILIIEAGAGDNRRFVGVIVEKVHEVVNLQKDEIESVPEDGSPRQEFLIGLGKTKERVIIILGTNEP